MGKNIDRNQSLGGCQTHHENGLSVLFENGAKDMRSVCLACDSRQEVAIIPLLLCTLSNEKNCIKYLAKVFCQSGRLA